MTVHKTKTVSDLIAASTTPLDRRQFLRLSALGAAVIGLPSLLAACGGDDDDETPEDTGSDEPTETVASTEPDPTVEGTEPSGETPATVDATEPASEDDASPTASDDAPEPSPSGDLPYEVESAENEGGQLVYGSIIDYDSANPVISRQSNYVGMFSLVIEGLIREDPTSGQAMPLLANTWEISDDGTIYSFSLQEGVTWHDGAPFTAEDVEFTLGLIQNEATASPRFGAWSGIAIEVEDDTNISFTLEAPKATFLTQDCRQGIIPKHLLEDVAPEEMAQHPYSTGEAGVTVGTGPFLFEEWVRDDHMTFVRYPEYWNEPAHLDTFVLRIVPSQTIMTQQIRTGELDVALIPSVAYDTFETEPNVTVVAYDSGRTVWYGYNLDPEHSTLFKEPEVRHALFYALNRPDMVEAVEFGLAQVAIGYVPPHSWAANPDAMEPRYDYDPELANQLLDEAGWLPGSDGVREKEGQRLSFTMNTQSGSDILEQYITVMQQQWNEIGVEMTPQFEESNALIERLTSTYDFETFLFNNGMGLDPGTTTTYWTCEGYETGFNFTMYCNERIDELAQEAIQKTDPEVRRELYTEMHNILLEDLPVAFISFQQQIAAMNNRVHNYYPNSVNQWFGSNKWWVDG